MSSVELIVRGPRVVHGGRVQAAAIHVAAGKIAAVTAYEQVPQGVPVIEAGDRVVMPGVVDAHVHINEPGRTEWEGFETATRAAASGGTTTLVDMPLNSTPVTTTRQAFLEKRRHAEGRCTVDVAFWGGVIPGNQGELEGMLDAGIAGFKCFLVHSGIDDFPNVAEGDLRKALPILARRKAVLLVHAEVPGPIDAATEEIARRKLDPRAYATFLASRPRASENQAIELVVRLCREYGCRTHIVHLSSSDAVPTLLDARREGLPVTSETCPHYLTFCAEEIQDGLTPLKCCPPIRERDNREALWRGLAAGTIDLVVSDHSPCTPSLKRMDEGDFLAAWGGIAGLQLSLSAVWTEASQRGHGIEQVAEWMCARPATLAGLATSKGAIAVGHDADLVIFDAEARFEVQPEDIQHRHKVTPYAGRTLRGVVEHTILRGRSVYQRGRPASDARLGRLL